MKSDFTPLARFYFARLLKEAESWTGQTEAVQRRQLAWLLSAAKRTATGEECSFGRCRGYEDFARKVPIRGYEQIREQIMRMLAGERNVSWPGRIDRFAQSSGTSDGKSKYIPITKDALKLNHYPGAAYAVAFYLKAFPESRLFSGKGLILGGSFANEVKDLRKGVKVGDLSAHLIERVNPLVNCFRVPKKEVALMEDWERKLPALAQAASSASITNISGVPSWMLVLMKEILKMTGAGSLHEIWPELEVFFHGGISFEPYRRQYESITDSAKMRYLETYNASEGFFAVQDDMEQKAMLLLLGTGVFYEFIPLDLSGEEPDSAEPLPAWKVEEGKSYALVITSCNGLWRYAIGDVVRIESLCPLRITIAGRTKHYINAFGEELMVHNADAAIAKACLEEGCSVLNYTAAPVYASDHGKGRHEWLIEFALKPKDTEAFARRLDALLQQENSDYQAKRSKGIFLDCLTVVEAKPGLFDRWLASTGKLGGQRKVPRLCNSRRFIDEMLSLNR